MPHDEGLAARTRDDLAGFDDIVEKRMFGGVCFMKAGHMLCGSHAHGVFYRVGKARHAEALTLPGVTAMQMAGRRMAGFVDAGDAALADDTIRAALLRLALAFHAELPER